ncbi:MAG: NYN domain-containing protein [Rhodospirillales bacterium]|nr:NYN domain-containing protein [Rhodospirillales bacterium]
MNNAAILIDGGYLLKRLPAVRPDVDASDPDAVATSVYQLVRHHLDQLNDVYCIPNPSQLLYRTFYYDARPYAGKAHTPVGNRPIDYARTSQALFRERLFKRLHGQPNLAVRLGEVRKDPSRSWILREGPQKAVLKGRIAIGDLSDADFTPALRQKGVDMRIGLDIASITLKRQADVIILVSGDADFVPAAKLARREGVKFILDPLWQDIPADLFEHIDGLRSGFYRPRHDNARRVRAPARSDP